MATTAKSQEAQTKAQGTTITTSSPQGQSGVPGVILMGKKKKKKKKKYSRGLRTIQELEVVFTKANRRSAKAVTKGLDKWISNRNKSARKKKNGAIRHSLKNSSKGLRKYLSTSSKVPADLLDGFAKLKITKNLLN